MVVLENGRIVKVQISVATNAPVRQAMVYDVDRQWFWQGDAFPEVIELMGGRFKAYFYARLLKNGKIQLEEKVEDQPW